MSEEKTIEVGTKLTAEDSGDGDKPKEDDVIANINRATERMEIANKKKEELLNREAEIIALQKIGGKSEGGTVKEPPKKLNDKEYFEAYEKGEVNPFKEDGYL